ncbi:ABC transporter substrate-binding protein [Streptacidiphilus jiangxiensis]|uniref:Peptide/nickel transport system substrate-binding protein n=1 Tax=Streptacidiphilus jiangxiensis TaxID=235985 RepID=A0A1H8A2I3_STRJI|nr:ABC transporter substrate-binding protein [Streptacidiphilus jiangxiensis]SEM64955.1 peptide/nickel transport system substrate-binding protein [Streptacidiphilus jiangxiensis]
MMRKTRSVALLATATALALGVTACSSSSKSTGSGSSDAVQKGGTLTYLAPSDFDSLDPQRVYTTEGQNMVEEIVRTLTGWQEKTDGSAPKLVGDLATDTGEPSQNDTVWTFHLKPGVKYQDGTAVTSQDIKYGVERFMSPDITGGPGYAAQWLVGASSYKGPFKGQDLASIQTPDSSTIVFHLNQPVYDFNETTAMAGWAPVPKAHDTGANYSTGVWATGPYMIKSYSKGKELVLVKNPYWSASSDPIRDQNVDEIDMKQGLDRSAIDQQLRADGPDAMNAVQQWPIAGADLTQIANDPTLKSRYHVIKSPGISYLALNVNRIKDIHVRQAIEFALDKTTARGAFGGSAYGDYASTMLAPGVEGHKDFNLYATSPSGDQTKAKALLAQAGNPKLTLSLAVENTPTQTNFADAVKSSLANVGITVNIVPVDQANYFSTLDNTKNQYDMAWMDWIPDWPNPSTVLPILFDGRQIAAQPASNQDISYLNDPAVNSQIDTIAKMTDPATADAAYGALDQQILADASVVPLFYMNFDELSGGNVQGLVPDPVNASLNFAHVWLKH